MWWCRLRARLPDTSCSPVERRNDVMTCYQSVLVGISWCYGAGEVAECMGVASCRAQIRSHTHTSSSATVPPKSCVLTFTRVTIWLSVCAPSCLYSVARATLQLECFVRDYINAPRGGGGAEGPAINRRRGKAASKVVRSTVHTEQRCPSPNAIQLIRSVGCQLNARYGRLNIAHRYLSALSL